jgi:hypothetical protein
VDVTQLPPQNPAAAQTAAQTPTTPTARIDRWRSRTEASRKVRQRMMEVWKNSVRFRVQKPYNSVADETAAQDRVAVPEDWARSKQKAALLNFQLPKIVAMASIPELAPKQAAVTAAVNEVLRKEARAAYMIDECLADAINASGIGVSVLGVDERIEEVEIEQAGQPETDPLTGMPAIDPVTGGPVLGPPTMVPTKRLVSRRFYWDRVSPANFLWPVEFTGSDWEQAPWLGMDDFPKVAEVRRQYGDDVAGRATVAGSSDGDAPTESSPNETLATDVMDPESEGAISTQSVRRTTIYYKAAKYDSSVLHPDALHRLVFIDGVDTPVIDEALPWQEWQAEIPEEPAGVDPMTGQPTPGNPGRPGYFKGLTGFPIRVLTLTYVSDLSVPPSDSQAGRPQVRELIRSRSQMLRMRDSSLPLRWYDVNRIDEDVIESMRRGEYNDMIPSNGPGDRSFGEVARATFPRENFQFQSILNNDLDRSWSLSNNSLAVTNTGKKSATEINAISGASQVRLDYEKSRVSRVIAEGAAVLFGLMQLVANRAMYVPLVGPGGAEVLSRVVPTEIDGPFSFTFMSDSSDRVDPLARQDRVLKLWNLTAQSPNVNRKALLEEMYTAHGLDTSKILVDEPPSGPPPPNVNFAFKGEDLLNPMAVAVMNKAGYKLEPADIAAAAKMIEDAQRQIMLAKMQPELGGPPQPQPPMAPGAGVQIEAPPTENPILKRASDGSRMT